MDLYLLMALSKSNFCRRRGSFLSCLVNNRKFLLPVSGLHEDLSQPCPKRSLQNNDIFETVWKFRRISVEMVYFFSWVKLPCFQVQCCRTFVFLSASLKRQWPTPCRRVGDFPWQKTNSACRCSSRSIQTYACPWQPLSLPLSLPLLLPPSHKNRVCVDVRVIAGSLES